MRTRHGRETANRGFYFSFQRRELLNLEERQALPGTKSDTFYHIPLGMMLILGPLIGLFYVLFLPFISLAMVAVLLFKTIWLNLIRMRRRLVQVSNRIPRRFQTAKVNPGTGRVEPGPFLKMNEPDEKKRNSAA